MSATFQLPSVGSTANWGSIINDNFTFLSDEIKKLYSSFNTVQALVGANTPYIKIDENQYFVKLTRYRQDGADENSPVYIRFEYYSKSSLKNNPDTPNNSTSTYILNSNANEWVSELGEVDAQSPPFFLGAYIFDFEDEINSTSETINVTGTDFHKNDFMVHFHALGSLYGNNAVSASVFKKYPPMGEYYKPILNTENPYKLEFERIDYVDWFRNEDNLTYTLPSIGYGSFCTKKFSKSENLVEDTVNFDGTLLSSKEDLTVQVNYYLVTTEDGTTTKKPIIIYNTYSIALDSETKEVTITIKCDTSSLTDNEELQAEIYILNNNQVITPVSFVEA